MANTVDATDQIINSTTVFTLTIEVPTENADSTRRYLTTPALGLGANLIERTHEWWNNGGQVITHKNIVWGGKAVES